MGARPPGGHAVERQPVDEISLTGHGWNGYAATRLKAAAPCGVVDLRQVDSRPLCWRSRRKGIPERRADDGVALLPDDEWARLRAARGQWDAQNKCVGFHHFAPPLRAQWQKPVHMGSVAVPAETECGLAL